MENGIFITVRTGSTRLPRKALLPVAGQPAISYLMRRMQLVTHPAKIMLCTTTLPEDDVLERCAREMGIACFRGSVDDKLERWNGAAHSNGIDFFVTADGDDLLCDPQLIDIALEMAADQTIDFIRAPGIVCGAFTYGIRSTALKRVCEIKDSSDTEMMWVYFTDTGLFKVTDLKGADQCYYGDDVRMTLDYPEDLTFFEKVIGHFESLGRPYFLKDVLEWLRANPQVPKINIQLQERFLSNQRAKTSLKLKHGKHERA